MMIVNEVSKLTGVSIRTLQYYDSIGLLKPSEYTESGYRLCDDTALERAIDFEESASGEPDCICSWNQNDRSE